MKKFFSIILCAVLVFSCISPAAFAYVPDQNKYPVIRVPGARTRSIYDKDGNRIYSFDHDTDTIIAQIKECLPSFAMGVATGDYSEWKEQALEIINSYYGPLRLDCDGEASNGSGSNFEYNKNNSNKNGSGQFDYDFSYDWRLSPMHTADELNEYIKAIISSTGCEKVSLMGRCYGSCVVLAYLI